jgi:mannose-6-phosphate isomerase-like protein (cupin superfamily)
LPATERVTIIENLSMVDNCILFNDDDDSAIEALNNVKMLYPKDKIIFANGGDRTAANIPEMAVKDVIFKFSVGGETKANSSSWILEEWRAPKTERQWGHYRVLYEHDGTKVKELTIMPGKSLTMQRHKFRSEHWHIVDGMCEVSRHMDSGYTLPSRLLTKHKTIDIVEQEWHQLHNPYRSPCRLIEIQYGAYCDEEDIERK